MTLFILLLLLLLLFLMSVSDAFSHLLGDALWCAPQRTVSLLNPALSRMDMEEQIPVFWLSAGSLLS